MQDKNYKRLVMMFSGIFLIVLVMFRPFRFFVFEMFNFLLEFGLFVSLVYLFICILEHPETLTLWYKFRKIIEGVSPNDRGYTTDETYQSEIFYAKKSKEDLVQLCKDKNIECNGLSKVQIIHKLVEFDINEHLKEHSASSEKFNEESGEKSD